MSVDAEMSLTQSWMRERARSEYESGVSMGMLFDTMAAHLMSLMMKLLSVGGDIDSSGRPSLTEAQREKRKRDLANEATWYLQQADAQEKQRFLGQSSEWYHHLVAGVQYYSKKDDSKAGAEFKLSLSFFESRAARLGLALVLIRSVKYVEALEELSRVYTSIYASYQEKFGDQHVEGLTPQPPAYGQSQRYPNPTSDYEWFTQHKRLVFDNADLCIKIDFLGAYAGLRPLMALVWFKLGAHDKALETLKLQLETVDEGLAKHWIQAPPPHHDRTLSMLGTLEVNRYTELKNKATSTADLDVAGNFLKDAVAHLSRAFQLNPNNPNVLNHLSNIFFSHSKTTEPEWDKIDGFASRAKELAQSAGYKDICAESSYYLGRSAHARGKYSVARQNYMDALVFSHLFPLPRYALAQLAFNEKDYKGALEHLSKLDARIPDLADTKAFLGKIHLQLALTAASSADYQTHFSSASKLLERAIALDRSRIASHLDLAQLKERSHPEGSLDAYLNAADLTHHSFIEVSGLEVSQYASLADDMLQAVKTPAEANAATTSLYPHFLKRINLNTPRMVFNNVAVMSMKVNKHTEAKDALLRSILIGACTLRASDASSLSSAPLTSNMFVNPSTYAQNGATASTALVFSALFGRPLRESLPAEASDALESFIFDSEAHLLVLNLSSGYNLGLVYEKLKDFERAARVYESILARYPHYLDAKLRLATLHKETGRVDDAERELKEIMSEPAVSGSKSSSADSQLETTKSMAGVMLTNILMGKKEYKETQMMLDSLVKKLSSARSTSSSDANASSQWTFGSDVYSLTVYANFFLQTSYSSPNRSKNLKWATDLFLSVLKQAPGNIYAANGLAIINALHAKDEMAGADGAEDHDNDRATTQIGEKKASVAKWSEKSRSSMNAFLAIREAVPNLPDILVNLGHLSFAVGDYRGATKHYTMVWKQLGGESSAIIKMGQVTQMLARCWFELGNFDKAREIVASVLPEVSTSEGAEANPNANAHGSTNGSDPLSADEYDDLRYNWAVMCKEWAGQILARLDLSLKPKAGHRSDADNGNDDNGLNQEASASMDVDEPESSASKSKLSSNGGAPQFRFAAAPTEEEQHKAVTVLNEARKIFEKFSTVDGETARSRKVSFSTKKCNTFAKLCEKNAELATEKLEMYRDEMKKESERREEIRLKEEEAESARQSALAEQEEALKRQLEAENEIAEAMRLKSQQIMEDWVASGGGDSEEKRPSRRGKSRRYDSDSDDDRVTARRGRATRNSADDGEEDSGYAKLPDEDDDADADPDLFGDDSESDKEFAPEKSSGTANRREKRVRRAPAADSARAAGVVDDEDEPNFARARPSSDENTDMAADTTKRRSALEELAARRNLAKRAHADISHDSGSNPTSSTVAPSGESETGADNGSAATSNTDVDAPSVKRRKLVKGPSTKESAADDDDLEIPDGL